jgi:hypothetical protein
MLEAGKLNLQPVAAKGSSDLDIINMKAGEADIAPYAVFIDLSGTGGRAVQVGRTALPDSVSAGSVLSVNADPAGRANLIVLRNVTGDAWLYGFTTVEQGQSYENEDGTVSSYSPNTLVMENQYGRQIINDPRNQGKNSGSSVLGIAVGTNGNVLSSKSCTRVNNVRRSDFSGNAAVTVSGIQRPIPDGLMVYVQATKKYVSIADARLNSNNFTVFLDKPAADGGKPRFIIAL